MTSKPSTTSLSDKPLKDLTVIELKDLCKERGIKGFAHKSKAKLLEMIETASGGSAKSATKNSSQPKPSKSRTTLNSKTQKVKAKTSQGNGQQGDLASLTVDQLKQLCKDKKIKVSGRKNKQQLLALINSTVSSKSPNDQSKSDTKKKQDSDPLDVENHLVDDSVSDQLSSEDLDANQIDQEESTYNPSDAELDAIDTEAEENMIEISDSLILEFLSRFDRIESLLQRIAENSGNS